MDNIINHHNLMGINSKRELHNSSKIFLKKDEKDRKDSY